MLQVAIREWAEADPLTEVRPEAVHPISPEIPAAALQVVPEAAQEMGAAVAVPRVRGLAAALQGAARNPHTKAKAAQGAVAMGRPALAVQPVRAAVVPRARVALVVHQVRQGVVVQAPPVVQAARVVPAPAVGEKITTGQMG